MHYACAHSNRAAGFQYAIWIVCKKGSAMYFKMESITQLFFKARFSV